MKKKQYDLLFKRAKSVSIVDVLNYYDVPIKNNKVTCLWHEDKVPSAHLYVENNVGHCFGCKKGSFDPIDIVMLKEGFEFYNAMVFLNNNFVVSDNFVLREKKNLELYFKINDDIRQLLKDNADVNIIRKYSELIDKNNDRDKIILNLYGKMMKLLNLKRSKSESERDDTGEKVYNKK